MEIEISKGNIEKIEKISKELGIKKSQIIDKAILLYLENISKYLDLREELNDWDYLSDEALINFEKSL